MKRFGTIFPFLESGRQPRRLGRAVANYEFVKALLTYGTFDEYVFSNSSLSNLAMFAETVRGWGLGDDRLARVAHVGYADLPAALASRAFHAFHLGGWGWFMPGLHYLRARHASNPWPITAVTHSLNGRELVDHSVRLAVAGGAPYDAIFCTSRDGREAMRRLLEAGAAIAGGGREFRGCLEHLPLGIDDELLDRSGDREGSRARLEVAPDAIVLLVLARISAFHKMDLAPFFRALARQILPASPRPIVLLLAGSASPDDLALVQADLAACNLNDHARVYANFETEERPHLLAAADVLLAPVDNTQETFGLSLLEAMAVGLPVVASRFDGYKDLVEDGVDGFLIDTYGAPADPLADVYDVTDSTIVQLFQSQSVAVDLGQLADRVLRLVTDDARRAAMGRAGRIKVDREYRWSRVIGRYEETWDRLAAEARTAGAVPAAANPYDLGSGRLFPHYVSHPLTADDRVVWTGAELDIRPYNEAAGHLTPALLAEVLSCVREAGPAGVSAGEVLGRAHAAPADAWFALLWLLKYGVLRLRSG